MEWDVPKSLTAPVVKGEQVGRVAYFVNGELYREFPVTSTENVPEITYFYCIIRIIRTFCETRTKMWKKRQKNK